MKKIGFVKETYPNENRVSLLPNILEKYSKMGAEVAIETNLGQTLHITDEEYKKLGAQVLTREEVFAFSDILLRLRQPEEKEISHIKKKTLHISFLNPFQSPSLVEAFAKNDITAISIEMMPRTTIAQKMDALSSQANLAGYFAVIKAAEISSKICPMMTTPAGTISPIRFFIIGVGVAGLQAIATARRLGARVEAFDTRPVVEEQVKSLGAKFVKVDLGETGQTKEGYAKALSQEQLEKQKEVMAKVCSQADVVITTAQIFGKKAPVIITQDMIKNMKKGSILVDMAVETGGNIEGSVCDKIIEKDNVTIIGLANMANYVPYDASYLYASNLYNLIAHFWDKEKKEFIFDLSQELLEGCVLTHDGKIVNKKLLEGEK